MAFPNIFILFFEKGVYIGRGWMPSGYRDILIVGAGRGECVAMFIRGYLGPGSGFCVGRRAAVGGIECWGGFHCLGVGLSVCYNSGGFEIFLIFPNFLRFLVLSGLATHQANQMYRVYY